MRPFLKEGDETLKAAQKILERRRPILPSEGTLLQRVRQFLVECWEEVKRAQRPTREEVIRDSMAVLVVVVAAALYLVALDVLLAKLLAFLH
ncbi:MAG: hypothetical protein LKKZDAJK_000190 [Candidatus Fervidibacter sp.]